MDVRRDGEGWAVTGGSWIDKEGALCILVLQVRLDAMREDKS